MLVAIIIQIGNLECQKYDRAFVTWPPGPATAAMAFLASVAKDAFIAVK